MIRLLQALLLLTLLTTSAVAQGRRIALVVGIDAYAHLPPLHKAVADARAVAAVLKDDLAFTTVISGENLTREALLDKLGDLDAAIQPGDLVFLFFAGHGVAFGSNNYLLPADLRLPTSSQAAQANRVIDNALAVDALIRRIQAQGTKTTFLVLDACRDNPFGERAMRNIGNERGLARMEAPQGVFVLYSAGYGQKALDRLPGNDATPTSVFTRHLIPALKTPGLSHVAIAKRVQEEVDKMARDSAGHAQQPAYYDQIIGSVVFRDLTAVTQPAPPRSAQPPASTPPPHQQTPHLKPGWCSSQPKLNASETAICTTEILSDLDLEMDRLFEAARERMLHAAAKSFTQQQYDWGDLRDLCDSDVACLKAAYVKRNEQLRRL